MTTTDFEFRTGNSSDLETWSDPLATPSPEDIALDTGGGGSARVTLIWADNAIENEWFQVTVKANGNTGLAAPDVFYFGNTTGEVGNLFQDADPDALVTFADLIQTRNDIALMTEVTIENGYDFNRDRFANYSDLILCRNNINLTSGLELITAPISDAAAAAPASTAAIEAPSDYAANTLSLSLPMVASAVAEAAETNAAARTTGLNANPRLRIARRAATHDAGLAQPIEQAPLAYNPSLSDLSWMSDYERTVARHRSGRKNNSAEDAVDELLATWP